MTMPNERTRALRWGYEFLQELSESAALDPKDAQCVVEILLHYPQPEHIKTWAREEILRAISGSSNPLLSPEGDENIDESAHRAMWSTISAADTKQALVSALELFKRLRRLDLPTKFSDQIPYVLRHFPPSEIEIGWLCRAHE